MAVQAHSFAPSTPFRRFASEAQASTRSDCRIGGAQLHAALEALSSVLATRVMSIKPGDVNEVLQKFRQVEQ